MRKLILRMAVSLDGVVAPERDDVFDHEDEDVWSDHFRAIASVDTVLLGAGMHREYLSFWHKTLTDESASASARKYAALADRLPHLVLSRSPRTLDLPTATVLAGGVDGIAELKQKTGGDLVLWGGARAAAAAIEAGIVDEYHLVTHPVIAGPGKKLFDHVEVMRRLRHQDTTSCPSGIVIHKYARA